MKKILIASLLIINALPSIAQKKCGHQILINDLKTKNPLAYAERIQNIKALDDNQTLASKGTQDIIIPVVFNILLTQNQFNIIGGVAGIEKRIDSQIAVLNRDFNGLNSDIIQLPLVFNQYKANSSNIRFGKAQIDPSGAPSLGYRYKIVSQTEYSVLDGTQGSGFAASDAKYDWNNGLAPWDNSKYLNIWVCNLEQGILGVALPPSFVALGIPNQEKGVVVSYRAFGKRSSLNDSYISGIDKGRTLVHEIGHYFELEHIWGENDNCSDDDGIADTRKQDEANYNCPSAGTIFQNCNNEVGGEMWMNYMDYVDDGCMIFFTQGQINRVLAQLNPGGASHTLTQNPHLNINHNTVQLTKLQISPNPAKDIVLLSYNTQVDKLSQIKLLNVNGQIVKNFTTNNHQALEQLNISDIGSGIYFIQANFEKSGTIFEKIVITK